MELEIWSAKDGQDLFEMMLGREPAVCQVRV